MKLLIIEDSERLRKSLVIGFKQLGLTIDSTHDGREGLNCALCGEYDIIVLDIMLPTMDGLSVLAEIREQKLETPILILSAKDQVEDRVKGLNIGADDYLCKPFSFDELHARINTLIRRANKFGTNQITIDNITIDIALKQILKNGTQIKLTPNEYSICEHLALNLGRVITYSNLENHLYNNNTTVSQNALEAHVSSLRKKLKRVGINTLIQTRRGFGYYIEKHG